MEAVLQVHLLRLVVAPVEVEGGGRGCLPGEEEHHALQGRWATVHYVAVDQEHILFRRVPLPGRVVLCRTHLLPEYVAEVGVLAVQVAAHVQAPAGD
jgi:hypothetical protein